MFVTRKEKTNMFSVLKSVIREFKELTKINHSREKLIKVIFFVRHPIICCRRYIHIYRGKYSQHAHTHTRHTNKLYTHDTYIER